MNRKIIILILFCFFVSNLFLSATALESDSTNTTNNISKTASNKESDEEPQKTLEPVKSNVIRINRKIKEISKAISNRNFLIDKTTTDITSSSLEIRPKKTADLDNITISIKEYVLNRNEVPEGKKIPKLLRNEMNLGRFLEIELPTKDIEWTIIRINYNQNDIINNNINEWSLSIIWYDEDPTSNTFEEWIKLRRGEPEFVNGIGIDSVEGYVWANVSHSSVYGLTATIVGPIPPPTTSPPPTTIPPTTTPPTTIPPTTAPPTTMPPTTVPPTTSPPSTTIPPTTAPPTTIPPTTQAPNTTSPTTTTQPNTTAPPTTIPAIPTLPPEPTTKPPTITSSPGVMYSTAPEITSPPRTRKHTLTRYEDTDKGICGPTSILVLALAPLFLLSANDKKRR